MDTKPETGNFSEQEIEERKRLDTDDQDDHSYVDDEEEEEEEEYILIKEHEDVIQDWDRVFADHGERQRARRVGNYLERDTIEIEYLKQEQRRGEIAGWPSLLSSGLAARRVKYCLSTEELKRIGTEDPKHEPIEQKSSEPDEWPTLSGSCRPLLLREYFLLTEDRKRLETEDPKEEPKKQKSGETYDEYDEYDEYDCEYTSLAQPVRTRRDKYFLLQYRGRRK